MKDITRDQALLASMMLAGIASKTKKKGSNITPKKVKRKKRQKK